MLEHAGLGPFNPEPFNPELFNPGPFNPEPFNPGPFGSPGRSVPRARTQNFTCGALRSLASVTSKNGIARNPKRFATRFVGKTTSVWL